MMCCQKQQVKQKKTGYTGSWAPFTLAQPPPPPPNPVPPLKPPKMGFWQQVVPKKEQKTGKKHPKLKKKQQLFFSTIRQPVNRFGDGRLCDPWRKLGKHPEEYFLAHQMSPRVIQRDLMGQNLQSWQQNLPYQ